MVVLVIMGVCGSGKTSVSQALSDKLQCVFRDADEFHSVENKQKMSSGVPLTDKDRIPWLTAIHDFIRNLSENSATGIVTCSALKKYYRHVLVVGPEKHQDQPLKENSVLFVYLRGTAELIGERLKERTGHFMPPALLQSQFEILEEPEGSENHITVDIEKNVKTIVSEVLKYLENNKYITS